MFIKNYQAWLMVGCLFVSSSVWAQIREYHLHISEDKINLTGKSVQKITVNGQFPAPVLSFEEGDEAVIHVHNGLKEDSSIHWHGLLLPGLMDGVPGFNQYMGIAPKGHFEYRFKIRQNGTYWYHAHSKGQEQDGLYGAFVVYPKGKMPIAEHEKTEQDHIVMLSDFHESHSQTILNNLKKSHVYYQNQRETLADVWRQIKRTGVSATWQDRKMWNDMRMLKSDLSDVTGYTFLINGKTPEQNWTGMFNAKDKVRLRFINASAMSFFDVRIPNLKMTVVSADGQPVQPVAVDEFRIGTAETYDVIVEPTQGHYQIEAESIDRTGFAIGTLHQQDKPLHAGIHLPQARPRAVLSMEDMGMSHGEDGNHSADSHGAGSHGTAHGSGSHANHQMGHAASTTNQSQSNPSYQVDKNTEYAHHGMAESVATATEKNTESVEKSAHHMMDEHSANHQDHSSHATQANKDQHPFVEGWANASTPQGHYALQYKDLKSLTPQKDTRQAEREIVVHLSGNMERYIWTINGKKFSEVEPLQVKYGERIRIKFVNESMMAHPMHLHGMFMQLENGQEIQDLPNKHTLVVPPYKTVTALLTADEIGEWALHCHLMYHMSAGMMSKLIVANVEDGKAVPTSSKQPTSQTLPQSIGSMPTQGAAHEHH